jgi:hypothetical protein
MECLLLKKARKIIKGRNRQMSPKTTNKKILHRNNGFLVYVRAQRTFNAVHELMALIIGPNEVCNQARLLLETDLTLFV